MRPRFIEIRRKAGLANQIDSIIRYKLKFLPISLDMKLIQVVPEEVLYYEVSEKFADRGKLIFEIKTTKDGNNRLVIYTAFDYKHGKGAVRKIFMVASKRNADNLPSTIQLPVAYFFCCASIFLSIS